MSTARGVPETWELTGDDAWRTLQSTGWRRLLRDAYQRLRWADGFSHVRSMAFMVSLAAIQGLIAIVGLTTAFGGGRVADIVVRGLRGAAPGPVATLLTQAVVQARGVTLSHNYLALILGTVGWLLTTTTALGQLERGLNRIYGIEQDRPSLQKYGLAFALALTVGMLLLAALVILAFGRTIGDSIHYDLLSRAWDIARWPLGLAATGAAVGLLFRWCPRRHQPAWSWLAFGSGLAVVLWFVTTVAFGVFFRHSASFGRTYGPLAGVVALLLWSFATSLAVLFGAAVAAQLEAVRANAAAPKDEGKVERSEPEPAGRH